MVLSGFISVMIKMFMLGMVVKTFSSNTWISVSSTIRYSKFQASQNYMVRPSLKRKNSCWWHIFIIPKVRQGINSK